MGDHRMMSKSIILTDNFLDMPTSKKVKMVRGGKRWLRNIIG